MVRLVDTVSTRSLSKHILWFEITVNHAPGVAELNTRDTLPQSTPSEAGSESTFSNLSLGCLSANEYE